MARRVFPFALTATLLTLAIPLSPGVCAAAGGAPSAPAATAPAGRPISERIAALVAAYERASRAVVGVSVVSVASGARAAAIREGELLVPASNQKLLTTAFALSRLGADFRFKTVVWLLDEGDLLVAGDYDPTLGDPILAAAGNKSIYAELDRWAAALKAKGVTTLGDILLCTSNDENLRHPDWPARQHQRWYAAPAGRLNFHNNCFDVTFNVGGGTVTAAVTPQSRFIRVVNQVRLSRQHLWSLRTSEDESVVTLTGRVKQRTPEPTSIAVDRPALLLGHVLADRLVRAGVRIRGGIQEIAPAAAARRKGAALCQTTTPLPAVLKRANKRSLNMTAECIFLRAGDGTWTGSARLMTRTLVKTFGLEAGSFRVRDGGGFSRANRVSPGAMTKLLHRMLRHKGAGALVASLPIGGVDGSLADRLTGQHYRRRVLGKTGWINGASCLSGYVLDGRGRPALAFSILINRVPPGGLWKAKRAQDQICRMLVDAVDGR